MVRMSPIVEVFVYELSIVIWQRASNRLVSRHIKVVFIHGQLERVCLFILLVDLGLSLVVLAVVSW